MTYSLIRYLSVCWKWSITFLRPEAMSANALSRVFQSVTGFFQLEVPVALQGVYFPNRM